MKSDPLTLPAIVDRLLPIATDLSSVVDDLRFQVLHSDHGPELLDDFVTAGALLDAIFLAHNRVTGE